MRRSNILLTVCRTLLVACGLLVLSSCGGGGGGGGTRTPGDQVMITLPGGEPPRLTPAPSPPADHTDEADTAQAATDITGEETVTGYIDSAGDVDYFQMTVSEPSVIELEFEAPIGTEISALDETGRVLVSGVVSGSSGSQGLGTQSTAPAVVLMTTVVAGGAGTVTLPPFAAEAGKKILIRIGVGAAGVVARNPYVLAIGVAAAAGVLYMHFKEIPIRLKGGVHNKILWEDIAECRENIEERRVENCSVVNEHIVFVTIYIGYEEIGTTIQRERKEFVVWTPCGAQRVKFESKLVLKLGSKRIPIPFFDYEEEYDVEKCEQPTEEPSEMPTEEPQPLDCEAVFVLYDDVSLWGGFTQQQIIAQCRYGFCLIPGEDVNDIHGYSFVPPGLALLCTSDHIDSLRQLGSCCNQIDGVPNYGMPRL